MEVAEVDVAGERPQGARQALEQGRLARAVRADDGAERRGGKVAVQVVDRGPSLIAERQVLYADGPHGSGQGPEDRAPDDGAAEGRKRQPRPKAKIDEIEA